MKDKKIGFYNYTVILTYAGMLLSFVGVMKAIDGAYWDSLLCLMLSGLCDTFDGAVASTRERTVREKHFGIQIDSLCDLISFGVLPAFFVYCLSGHDKIVGFIGSVFTLCALIRLAYYNVLEAERQADPESGRKVYLGIPVTVVALFLPAVFMLYEKGIIKTPYCMPALLVLMAIGFLFPVSIKNPTVPAKAGLVAVGIAELVIVIVKVRTGIV